MNYNNIFNSKPTRVKIKKVNSDNNLNDLYKNNRLVDYVYECPNCDNILKIMMKDGSIVPVQPTIDECPACGQVLNWFID